MPRFTLQLDVVLDGKSEPELLEFARRVYTEQGGAVLNSDGTDRVSAEEFIDGTEQALLELLECNPLLNVAGLEVERLSCGRADENCETAGAVSPESGCAVVEDCQPDNDLDVPESGLYLCRWPNGDFSVVKADNKREAMVKLDEWAGANPEWLDKRSLNTYTI